MPGTWRRLDGAATAFAKRAAALAALFALLLLARSGSAQPAITRAVTDRAGVISPAAEQQIAELLVRHRQATGVQIAVLVVRTTSGEPIEDYSMRVAEAWAGGSRGRDDGVLYTLAIDDRRMRLEVGYGLEDRIPDAAAREIIDATRPELRAGDYDQAVTKVIEAVIARTRDVAPEAALAKGKRPLLQGFPNYAVAWLAGALSALAIPALLRRARRAEAASEPGPGRTPAPEATTSKKRRKKKRRRKAEVELAEPSPALRRVRLAAYAAVAAIAAGAIGGLTPFWIGYFVVVVAAIAATELCVSLVRRASRSAHRSAGFWVFVGAFTAVGVLPLVASAHEGRGVAGVAWALGFHSLCAFVVALVLGVMLAIMTAARDRPKTRSSGSSFWSSSSSGESWSSSSSSSTWSSSDSSSWSSSSDSSSWSGDGGSFGGGGASSSW